MAARARCRFAGGLRESQPCPGGHIGRPYVHASGFVAGMGYIFAWAAKTWRSGALPGFYLFGGLAMPVLAPKETVRLHHPSASVRTLYSVWAVRML